MSQAKRRPADDIDVVAGFGIAAFKEVSRVTRRILRSPAADPFEIVRDGIGERLQLLGFLAVAAVCSRRLVTIEDSEVAKVPTSSRAGCGFELRCQVVMGDTVRGDRKALERFRDPAGDPKHRSRR